MKLNLNTDEKGLPISINDIRDQYFSGESLSKEELSALFNYDKFRLAYLNAAENEEEFEKRYLMLQAKANLSSYKEFLDLSRLK